MADSKNIFEIFAEAIIKFGKSDFKGRIYILFRFILWPIFSVLVTIFIVVWFIRGCTDLFEEKRSLLQECEVIVQNRYPKLANDVINEVCKCSCLYDGAPYYEPERAIIMIDLIRENSESGLNFMEKGDLDCVRDAIRRSGTSDDELKQM